MQTLKILHLWCAKTFDIASSIMLVPLDSKQETLLYISPLVPQMYKVISGRACLSRSCGKKSDQRDGGSKCCASA